MLNGRLSTILGAAISIAMIAGGTVIIISGNTIPVEYTAIFTSVLGLTFGIQIPANTRTE